MSLRQKRTFFAALLYVLGAFLPSAHEAFFETRPCRECDDAARAPAFSAACDPGRPCDNPQHHHHEHRRHHHEQCPVCQQAKLCGIASQFGASDLVHEELEGLAPSASRLLPARRARGRRFARAPPRVS